MSAVPVQSIRLVSHAVKKCLYYINYYERRELRECIMCDFTQAMKQ